MPEPAIDFRRIVHLLTDAGVKFVIIGGVALHLHGADNLTLDMDISFARDRANTDTLAQVLSAQKARYRGFPVDLPCFIDGQMLRNATNLTLETLVGDFDLLAEPEGVDGFAGLWERATVMEIDGLAVRVASLDDLAAMKRVANRPKDQAHLMQIAALQRLLAEPQTGETEK